MLLADIEISRGITLIATFTDAVNFVIDGSTVVISHLTSTGDSPLDVRWMPGTNTSHLSQTLVSLTGELLGAPPAGDTLKAMALSYSDTIDHFVLLENGIDFNRLLEEAMSKVDLIRDRTAVHLNLHEMGFLLLERRLADLSVSQDAHDGAVLLDTLQVTSDVLAALLSVLLGILGERLLLALVPILVEAPFHLV